MKNPTVERALEHRSASEAGDFWKPWACCSGSSRAILLLLLIERMEVSDHLVQARRIQVRVDLGGLDAGMSQKLLQHAQVCTA